MNGTPSSRRSYQRCQRKCCPNSRLPSAGTSKMARIRSRASVTGLLGVDTGWFDNESTVLWWMFVHLHRAHM